VEEQRALVTLGRTYLFKAEQEGIDDETQKNHLYQAESNFRKSYKLISEQK